MYARNDATRVQQIDDCLQERTKKRASLSYIENETEGDSDSGLCLIELSYSYFYHFPSSIY